MPNSDSFNQKVKEYWSENSDIFDQYIEEEGHGNIHYGFNDDRDEDVDDTEDSTNRMNERLAETANVQEGDRVLHCGCGVGGPAIWAVENLGTEAVGLNIVGHQLERARQNAEEAGVADRTDFRYDDFTKMQTVEDDSIDVIWAIEAIVYAEDKKAFLEEARRVLRPGGRFVIAEGFRAVRNPSRKERKKMEKLVDSWALPGLTHIDDFAADMEELGFKNVEVNDITDNIMPFSRWQRLGMHYRFFVKILQLLGRLSEHEAKHLINQNNQYHVFNERLLTYNIISAEV